MIWMQTHIGIAFDLENITSELICLRDISVSLARQPRFNGHTQEHYTVAQHACLVADMVSSNGGSSELILAALLHDAHEAYTSDIPSPLKWLLGESWTAFKELESKVDAAIAEHFGIDPALFQDPLLKLADGSALFHEKHALMVERGHDWSWDLILGDKEPLAMPTVPEMDLKIPWAFVEATQWLEVSIEYFQSKVQNNTVDIL